MNEAEPRLLRAYSANANPAVTDCAAVPAFVFKPGKKDQTGVSVTLEPPGSLGTLLSVRRGPPETYWVAALRSRVARMLGATVNPCATDDDPGHAEIVELTYFLYRAAASKQATTQLMNHLGMASAFVQKPGA